MQRIGHDLLAESNAAIVSDEKDGVWIFIPILPINRSEKIWGNDAKEFKYVLLVRFTRCVY